MILKKGALFLTCLQFLNTDSCDVSSKLTLQCQLFCNKMYSFGCREWKGQVMEVPYFSLLKTMKSLWTLSNRCCNWPFCRRNKQKNISNSMITTGNSEKATTDITYSFLVPAGTHTQCNAKCSTGSKHHFPHIRFSSFNKMQEEEIDLTLEDTCALMAPPAPCTHTYLAHLIKWEHPAPVMPGCFHNYCSAKTSRQMLSHPPKEAVRREIIEIHHHYDTVLCVYVCVVRQRDNLTFATYMCRP